LYRQGFKSTVGWSPGANKGLQLATISNSASKIWPSKSLEIATGILMKSFVILKKNPFRKFDVFSVSE
jgi:hypothetical protein